MSGTSDEATAILVASSDGYQDLWRPFITLFDRYWADCPYPVYFGSNAMSYEGEGIRPLAVGHEADWTASFQAMLEAIPHRYVIVLLEDYFLTKPVDTARIAELARLLAEEDGACLRLIAVPGAPQPGVHDPHIGELPRGTPYRLSLQAAIWNRETLLSLLEPGESPWELELVGSSRTNTLPQPFLSVVQDSPPVLPYFCTGVVRGVWLRDALTLLRREGIDVASNRPREPFARYLRRRHGPRLKRLLSHWS